MLNYLAIITITMILMFLSPGCKTIPTQAEINKKNIELDNSIDRQNRINAEQKNYIEIKKKQIEYLQKKIAVLDEEKKDSYDNIDEAHRQIKNTFKAIQKVIADSEDQLFDSLVGNAPISRTNESNPKWPTVLVDRQNEVKESVLFCGGEIYCKNSVEIRFCILRPAKIKNDEYVYVIESVSEPFRRDKGRHTLIFTRTQRLPAQPGSLVGLYINEGNKIASDAFGTGSSSDIIVKKLIPGETSVTLPPVAEIPSTSNQLNGKAYSFRLFGSTYLK
jgi:hypothetical protein